MDADYNNGFHAGRLDHFHGCSRTVSYYSEQYRSGYRDGFSAPEFTPQEYDALPSSERRCQAYILDRSQPDNDQLCGGPNAHWCSQCEAMHCDRCAEADCTKGIY